MDLTALQRRVVVALGRWVMGQVSETAPEEMDDDTRYAARVRNKWTRGRRVGNFSDLVGVLGRTPNN